MRKLTAILCLTLAVLLGSAGMSWSGEFFKGLTAFQRGNYAIALRELTPLAEQGDLNAQYYLGRTYQEVARKKVALGEILPTAVFTADYKLAVKWFTLAAKQGDKAAQNSLGLMYRNGEGVPEDYKTAVKWFTLAAEQGDANAQEHLDILLIREKLKSLTLAAENGDKHASFTLGGMYNGTLLGHGIPKDREMARKWWKLAAEQGHSGAQEIMNISVPWWKFWAFYGWWRFW